MAIVVLNKGGGSFANKLTAVVAFANLATDIDKNGGGSFANIHTLTKRWQIQRKSLCSLYLEHIPEFQLFDGVRFMTWWQITIFSSRSFTP
jgi:hypothetical protein